MKNKILLTIFFILFFLLLFASGFDPHWLRIDGTPMLDVRASPYYASTSATNNSIAFQNAIDAAEILGIPVYAGCEGVSGLGYFDDLNINIVD